MVAARRLDFFAYTLHLPPGAEGPKSQWEALQWLKAADVEVALMGKPPKDLAAHADVALDGSVETRVELALAAIDEAMAQAFAFHGA